MKVYIAGKITGLPYPEAFEKFEKTERQLIDAGIEPRNIINPTKRVGKNTEWSTCMEICLPLLESCTAIYMQRDWRDSLGARRELTRAMELRLDPFFEEQNDLAMITNLIATGI